MRHLLHFQNSIVYGSLSLCVFQTIPNRQSYVMFCTLFNAGTIKMRLGFENFDISVFDRAGNAIRVTLQKITRKQIGAHACTHTGMGYIIEFDD